MHRVMFQAPTIILNSVSDLHSCADPDPASLRNGYPDLNPELGFRVGMHQILILPDIRSDEYRANLSGIRPDF
jgi:hypothetical protein